MGAASARRERPSLDRRMVVILLIIFVGNLGASMGLPILPLYAQRLFDVPPQMITLLLASFYIAQFIAAPVIGRLSDRYGRVPVLVISQIGTVISFIMLGAAGSVTMLLAGRVLDGITGGNIIVAQAYIVDVTPRERRTQALGLSFAAFGMGFIFGPALGGLLAAAFGDRVPFYVAALMTAVVVWLTYRMLPETLTPEMRARARDRERPRLKLSEMWRNRPLLLVLITVFGAQFGLGILQSTFALYGEAVVFAGESEQTINVGVGLLLGVIGFAQLITQAVVIRKLVRRFSEPTLVIIGAVLRTASLYVFAIFAAPLIVAGGGVLFALGTGIMLPTLQAIAASTVSDDLRGGVLGWYQAAASLSIILSTSLAGTLFAASPTMPYWVSGTTTLLLLIPAFLLFRWTRAHRPIPAAAPAQTS
jgi:DHA1 family tetracycline resistance protein-like MFS transporter